MPRPSSESLGHIAASCKGNTKRAFSLSSVHPAHPFRLPSVKESSGYARKQPGAGSNLSPLLHAVVFKRQIAIRAMCSDRVCPSVTVWLTLLSLSPCARWMKNTYLCFPRYFLCVFKNFLRWAWYLCFSIWRHTRLFVSDVCLLIYFHLFKPCLIYAQSL